MPGVRLNLQRDTDVFYSAINLAGGANVSLMNPTNTFKIEVLAGLSTSQDQSYQDITSLESGLNPDRSTQRFTTNLNAAQFNFQSYLRPTGASIIANGANEGNSRPLADWYLWQVLLSGVSPFNTNNTYSSAWRNGGELTTVTRAGTANVEAFNANFAVPIGNYLYIKMSNIIYQLSNACINQAEIDGSIDTIGKTTWSGFATDMVELIGTPRDNAVSVFGGILNNGTLIGGNAKVTYEVGQSATNAALFASYQPYTQWNAAGTLQDASLLINRLSTLGIQLISEGGVTRNFELPITSASLTINNNITFLAPDEIDIVNFTIGQFTGARTITGNFTAYLRAGQGNSANLLYRILQDTRTSSSAYCSANLRLGGNTKPCVYFVMPAVQFSVPTHQIDDIIGINVDFLAQETTTNQGEGGEITIRPLYSDNT